MARELDRAAILARLPQQPPFCFLDAATVEATSIRASYRIRGDEAFLAGHFKDNPVFPASIIFEALGQAGCLWIIEAGGAKALVTVDPKQLLFTSLEAARFFRKALPGDLLEMEMKLQRLRPPLAVFDGAVRVGDEAVAEVQRLVLMFGFTPLPPEGHADAR